MRFLEKQEKIETKVYEAINDLENELGLDVRVYPEVRWLGRKGRFEDLWLSEQYRGSVELNKRGDGSIFLYKPNIIIINKDISYHINEESAHFLHLNLSHIDFCKKTSKDWFATQIIVEMLGYLGSKILDPSRTNPYKGYPDYFSLAKEGDVDINQALVPLGSLNERDLSEFLIHSQGYGLAERIFYDFETDKINEKYIKTIFKKDFEKKNEAINFLIHLRKRFWPTRLDSLV